jgi:hypothetical protein
MNAARMPSGKRHDGDQGRAQVEQEDEADHGHHRKLFQQLVAQVLHRPLDQPERS